MDILIHFNISNRMICLITTKNQLIKDHEESQMKTKRNTKWKPLKNGKTKNSNAPTATKLSRTTTNIFIKNIARSD